ncbi:MAG: SusD/RagB family nutrient-binding outer membrane lipoprotein [Chitinophagaceae bacterium]|nr:MAG: SusD/RagB family nutrient-binding outer membrane lipoprotein [Chitinophagaceae bacterium]
MNFKYKSLLLVAVSGSMLLGSCKKGFLDINDNPNSPTDVNITPELIFTQAQTAVAARAASRNFNFITNWLGYTGASGSYAIDGTETTYNVDQTFGEGIWANNYNTLFDLYQVRTKAIAKGDTVLAGASMILSAKLWQDLVDVFGNIPYKQAFQGSTNPRPSYDNGQAVYNDLLLMLDTAKMYMNTTAKSTFATIDATYSGNQDNWIRFANTMKLRLLIHQTPKVITSEPTAELAKIMDGGTTLNIIRTSAQTASVQPGYKDEVSKQQPFYANYGWTPAAASANEITRVNQYLLDQLGNNADPRISRLSTSNTNGVVYGLSQGNPTSNTAARLGIGLVQQGVTATARQWVMTNIESLFLEAEAGARGWNTGTSAQTSYTNAVNASFSFLGAGSAASYLANSTMAQWPATQADQIRIIAYQKWVALTELDPMEVWTDFRRLPAYLPNGYLSVNPSANAQGIPNRLLYPQSEFTANSENALAQGVNNPYQKIFWQP